MFIEMVGSDEVLLIVVLRIDLSFLKIFVICFGVFLGRGNNVGNWGYVIVILVFVFCLLLVFFVVVCVSMY